jgi:hypothetical protein
MLLGVSLVCWRTLRQRVWYINASLRRVGEVGGVGGERVEVWSLGRGLDGGVRWFGGREGDRGG